MAFYLYDSLINLNISRIGKKIIEQDIKIFNIDDVSSYNGFINYLLKTYLENINIASFDLDITLYRKKDKGEAKPFRINQMNYDYLSSLPDSIYNKLDKDIKESVPLLIKLIVETYVRLPFIKREAFVFSSLLNECNEYINKNYLITIVNKEKMKPELIMKPVILVDSKEGSFTYLVGIDENDKERRVRVSEIKYIRRTNKIKKINEDTIINLKEKIVEYGATFIGEDIVTIKIRLTPKGISEYETSVIRRPIHKCIEENNIYVFECSIKQAQYFFLRFGEDAYVIEPMELRNRLLAIYQGGINIYGKKD